MVCVGVLPKGVECGGAVEPEGVELTPTEGVRTGYEGLGGEVDGDGNNEGICALAAADACNEGYEVGAGLVVGGETMVVVGNKTVAEIPMGYFGAFTGGDGVDTIRGDGAAVDELDVDTAVAIGDDGVESGQRKA